MSKSQRFRLVQFRENRTSQESLRSLLNHARYDGLNRVSAISYSDGTPGVNFAYDTVSAYGKGRLASVCTGSYQCESMVSYDPLGRVTASRQNLMGNVYSFSYGYNYRGALTSETYPSGRVVTTVYDSVNRPYTVSGVLGGAATNYVTGAAYAAQGGPAQISLGNSLQENYQYNSRLQLYNWWEQKGTDQTHALLWVALNYNTPAANNGNLQGMDEYVGGPGYPSYTHFGQSFTYDGVNRLSTATETGGWSRSFGYDSYGNRWVSGASGVPLSGLTPTSNLFAGNRMSGRRYDLAGDQIDVGTYTMAYDAENRIRSVVDAPAAGGGWVNYSYDANGKRVIKQYSDGGTIFYVYDAVGQLAAEYSSSAKTTNPACGTCYLTTDHLGSTRLITDAEANVIARHDFLPFGEEIPAGTAGRDGTFGLNASVNQKFTGKERDAETGLDYFFARYLSTQQGRFLSPDPGNVGASLTDPQSWNGYAYVRNSPLGLVDPSGMQTNCATTVSISCNGSSPDIEAAYQQYAAHQNQLFWGNLASIYINSGDIASAQQIAQLSSGAIQISDVSSAFNGQTTHKITIWKGAAAAGTVACVVLEPCGVDELIFGLIFSAAMALNRPIAYEPPPRTLPAFPDAVRVKPKAGRARWLDADKKIIEWDSQHGKVEVFNKKGNKHLGEYDPNTGEQTKPPKPGRSTPE